MEVILNNQKYLFTPGTPTALQTGSFKATINGQEGWMIMENFDKRQKDLEKLEKGQTRGFVMPPAGTVKQPAGNPTGFRFSDAQIARICHEANRVYCEAVNDQMVQKEWEHTDEQTQNSVISGVANVRANPNITPEQSHQTWFDYKTKEGWTLGPVKSTSNKTHPNLVPYDQLPESQKAKDHIFLSIVKALM